MKIRNIKESGCIRKVYKVDLLPSDIKDQDDIVDHGIYYYIVYTDVATGDIKDEMVRDPNGCDMGSPKLIDFIKDQIEEIETQ